MGTTVDRSGWAVVASARGGPEVLEVGRVPVGSPAAGEVRLRVEAAGISHADLLMMQGVHPERRRPPFVPGWDVVGIVDRVGARVDRFSPGDRVASLTVSGGWGEFAIAPAARSVRIPRALDPAEAVCAVMDAVVAYQMLTRTASVRGGDVVLVQGGAGGVGSALLRLAAAMDVRVVATDRRAKLGFLEDLGAGALDADRDDVVERCRDATGGRGVVAAFDGVGRTMGTSFAALGPQGTLVMYGLTAFLRGGRRHALGILATGAAGAAALGRSLIPGDRRRVRVYSIQRLAAAHPEWYRADLEAVLKMLVDGRLPPARPALVTPGEVGRAVEDLAAGRTTGKQVLVAGP